MIASSSHGEPHPVLVFENSPIAKVRNANPTITPKYPSSGSIHILMKLSGFNLCAVVRRLDWGGSRRKTYIVYTVIINANICLEKSGVNGFAIDYGKTTMAGFSQPRFETPSCYRQGPSKKQHTPEQIIGKQQQPRPCLHVCLRPQSPH